jgi:hypothetical protein
MQDDALDKILRDAANQYHPAYNDKAWEGMHARLDKHLPQKDENRKWLWLLLPLLVTFIAAGIVWISPDKKEAPVAVNNNNAANLPGKNESLQGTAPQADAPVTAAVPQAITNTATITDLTGSNGNRPAVNMPVTNTLLPAPAANGNNRGKFSTRSRTRAIIRPGDGADDLNDLDRAAPPPATSSNDKAIVEEPVVASQSAPPVVMPSKDEKENNSQLPVVTKNTVTPGEKKLPVTEKNSNTAKADKSKKQRSSFSDNFAFTLSAGPDYSFVKSSQQGEIQMGYGAGIAYTFAKRFTVRAGVYAAKKVYITDSASYKPGFAWATYFSNVEKIKGDCFVYEVPVSLSYDFAGKKNHHWFGNAGISSFFMKRETYTYYYNRNGTLVSRDFTVNDQSNHLLSVLTLSAGYRYRLSRHISFAAEPYLKLPLSGVGFGNLKLKSGGILFSAIVKPFSKRK